MLHRKLNYTAAYFTKNMRFLFSGNLENWTSEKRKNKKGAKLKCNFSWVMVSESILRRS